MVPCFSMDPRVTPSSEGDVTTRVYLRRSCDPNPSKSKFVGRGVERNTESAECLSCEGGKNGPVNVPRTHATVALE